MTTIMPATPPVPECERAKDAELGDWCALSLMSLWEVWDNDEDAVYDGL